MRTSGSIFTAGLTTAAALSPWPPLARLIWRFGILKAKLQACLSIQLLGGKSRDAALVYAHATGPNLEALLESIAHYQSEGYKAIRVQCGIPDMPDGGYATGKGGDTKHFITQYGSLPDQEIWDSEK